LLEEQRRALEDQEAQLPEEHRREEQRLALEAQQAQRLGCDARGKISWEMVDGCSLDL
jgi:hypothetical protein